MNEHDVQGMRGNKLDDLLVQIGETDARLRVAIDYRHPVFDWLVGEIQRLRKLEGTDDHPEHRCDRCGGRNISPWYADSDVWNRVAGDWSILCPICFSKLAEEAGIKPTAWRLSMEGDEPEVNKLRVRLSHLYDKLAQAQAVVGELEDQRSRKDAGAVACNAKKIEI